MKLKLLVFLALLSFMANPALAEEGNKEISFYTGTFDVIDKEGDDQTSLFGIEHKNPNLFRDTFLGKFSPEAIGDYIAGPNHVLPTTGSARFSSGLSVNDFLKRYSLIKITKTGIERLGASVINLAKYENLEGHANSVKIRLKKEN